MVQYVTLYIIFHHVYIMAHIILHHDIQDVSNLALHIVLDMYGEQVERICKVLLKNGPSTILDIIARLGENVDHNQVRSWCRQASTNV